MMCTRKSTPKVDQSRYFTPFELGHFLSIRYADYSAKSDEGDHYKKEKPNHIHTTVSTALRQRKV